MIYQAYELLAHLKHLTLTGACEVGLEWIGTDKQMEKMELEIDKYERYDYDKDDEEYHEWKDNNNT